MFTDLSDQSPDEADVITQENSIDITAFLFPAIGAVLMLMFGGLLFSSGTSLSKTKTMSDNRFKRKFEQQYGRRTIRFHNIPDKIAKEPSSVLQQENNDVVDAVKKEYHDLPQYQPVSGLVGDIAGLHGHTCAVNIIRPEVTERGVSPIHLTAREYTSDYDNPSYKDEDSDAEHEDGVKKKNSLTITLQNKDIVVEDDFTQRNRAASSGIGTNSPDSYEIDSLEEFPPSKNDSLDLAEVEIPRLRGGAPLNDGVHPSVPAFDRGVYSGGRLSVLGMERAPSSMCLTGCTCRIHRTEGGRMDNKLKDARTSDERLTWGDIALNANGNLSLENESDISKACGEMLRIVTPSAEISGPLTAENMREMNQSPLRRMDLEKWLHDVEKSRKTGEVAYDQTLEFPDAKTEKRRRDYLATHGKEVVPSRRKMRAPLQESLQLLKKLQLVADDDLASAQHPVHLGGRASCLDTVRAPSSLCLCGDHCRVLGQNDTASDQCIAPVNVTEGDTETDESTEIARGSHRINSTRTERITKGGRQSTLNLLRASSGMCVDGPTCRVHSQKMGNAESLIPESGTENGRSQALIQKQEMHSDLKELRGASVLGESQVSLIYRSYSTSNNQGIGDCAQEQSVSMTTERGENGLRGASSFGDLRSAKTQEIKDLNTRGASSFAEQPLKQLHANHSHETNSIQSYSGEMRGASGFAPLDASIAGTSSVTLSFAVESDAESLRADKSSMERKRAVSVGTFVEKGRAPDRKRGSKNINNASVSPRNEKQNHQTSMWKTEGTENFVEQNNISLTSHYKGCKIGTIARAEKTDLQKQDSKRFDERLLKVGKDTTMMYTLLNALRRGGKQKRKETETSNYDISHRIDEENVTNGSEASVGNLKFSVLYRGADSATPLLYVTVLGLEGVTNETATTDSTVYVKVCLSPKFTTWRRTRPLNVSEKLDFKDHFIISGVKPADLEEAVLRFVVVCVGEHEQVIGQLDVPLGELKSRDKFKRTCALHAPFCAEDDGTTELE